ncbi:substrate-binding periplasmic protein [Parachitinimonas caeni]|uniref:Transporter substrate-binding domain-containing protein n=1 Tax=Parachitinimonas caeni TaxID=3031301 RepID=A0ABT7DW03_9NEIS|nr:transporter substrate-binding domain-containing protein [Parachitinimonas caeni]MDK2123340.1 transporter substrate-binding domain-containing protein [Parachitinimonas caeni]
MQRLLWICAGLLSFWSSTVCADDEVIFPAPESAADVRHNDVLEMLRTSLERTKAKHGGYVLRQADLPMNKARQLATLSKGDQLTIIWSGTSMEMETDFLPVRIPLRKGLGGWRISLIAREMQPEFDKVRTLDDLKRFSMGQGNGWASADVLKMAGLNVVTSNYDSLFKMVAMKRIDMFPRGLSEAFVELEANAARIPNLMVEQSLVIRYDTAYYFFLNKQNNRLAKRIEEGLRMMIKDGSFDEIFWRYNGDSIRKARLAERRVIRIEDRTLHPLTPLADKSLWFDPATTKMPPAPK